MGTVLDCWQEGTVIDGEGRGARAGRGSRSGEVRFFRVGLLRGYCETRPADTRDDQFGRSQKWESAKSPFDAGIGCARSISSGADPKKPAPHPPMLRAPRVRQARTRFEARP